jgi:hypothetical protein
MLTAGCHQQDIVRQSNVHTSPISRLLSSFRVAWKVSAHQCHRRRLKITVHQDRLIVATLRLNRFIPAPKVANELHWASGARISDQSVRNRLIRNVNLHAWRHLVAIHLTQRHRQTHAAWAANVCAELSGNRKVLFSD